MKKGHLSIAFLLIFLIFSGCYTLLKHPTLQNDQHRTNTLGEVEGIEYRSDCIQCHVSSSDYYNPTLSYGHYYNNSSDRWLYYYDSPWWVQPYYYGGSTMENGEVTNPRNFGRRGVSTSDAPAAANPAAAAPPPSSGAVAKKGDTTQSSSTNTQVQKDNRRNEKGSEKSGTESTRTRKKKD
ncbi:hypothetical protein KC799_00430 [candidate division KSB1 bacterium]|nr:hypothetical protein [candidate division KSB1 bacterium]